MVVMMIFGVLIKLVIVFVVTMLLILFSLIKIEGERRKRLRKLQILRQMKYSSNFSIFDRNIFEDPRSEGIYNLFKQSDSEISKRLTILEKKRK